MRSYGKMPESDCEDPGGMLRTSLQPWETISNRLVYEANPWLRVQVQQVRLPDGTVVHDYHQITLPDGVIVFAQTADRRIVMERQYRHGVGKVSLTLPAGGLQDGERPLEAAQRELLEETGYCADHWCVLGTFVNHGSYGCGRLHMFIARDARQVTEALSRDLEEIEIALMSLEQIAEACRHGQVEVLSTMATILLGTNPIWA